LHPKIWLGKGLSKPNESKANTLRRIDDARSIYVNRYSWYELALACAGTHAHVNWSLLISHFLSQCVSRFKRSARIRLLQGILGVLVTSSGVQAQDNTASSVAAVKPPNAVTQGAFQRGVLSCASRIEQVTNHLGFSSNAGAMLITPAQPVDKLLVPIIMEVPVGAGSAYVSATVAPNQANGCGATYDAVMYWPQSCAVVAQSQYAAFKPAGAVKSSIQVLDGGAATKVYLMPAGAGCVSIKKELVM
jgi:hypothetical protein